MSDRSLPPGPGTVERAVAAFERTKAALLDDPMLASDENAIATAFGEAGAAALTPDQLLNRVALALDVSMRRADAARLTAESARARQERYARRIALNRLLLVDLLTIFDRRTFHSDAGTVSLKAGTSAGRVTDESRIPDTYYRTTRTLDRTALLDDARHGVVIPGYELSNGPPTASLRRDSAVTVSETSPAPAEAAP